MDNEEQFTTESPQFGKTQEAQVVLDFSQMVAELLQGKKATKIEWGSENTYVFIQDEYLMIKLEGKEEADRWILRTADLDGKDYVVIGNIN